MAVVLHEMLHPERLLLLGPRCVELEQDQVLVLGFSWSAWGSAPGSVIAEAGRVAVVEAGRVAVVEAGRAVAVVEAGRAVEVVEAGRAVAVVEAGRVASVAERNGSLERGAAVVGEQDVDGFAVVRTESVAVPEADVEVEEELHSEVSIGHELSFVFHVVPTYVPCFEGRLLVAENSFHAGQAVGPWWPRLAVWPVAVVPDDPDLVFSAASSECVP